MLPAAQDARVVPKLEKVPEEPMWSCFILVLYLTKVEVSLGEHLKYFK